MRGRSGWTSKGRHFVGPDRERDGRRRETVRAVVYAACGAVLLAGCASMPDSGDLRGVESTPRQDAQVRVFALPPHENAPPGQIVQGFLEALTSDDPHYETALKYLTPRAAKTWRPDASTTVLDGGPTADPVPAGNRDDSADYASTLTGGRFATLDSRQSYEPADGQYRETLHLTREKKSGQWRIDDLPQGIVMGKSDFLRNYTSVNRYYFASNTPTESNGQPVSVADPVYVRKKVDSMTQTVSSLLEGPSRWLGPVVRSSFPTGTALKKGVTSLAPDDQNRLTVPLNDKASRVGAAKCTEMAAQLLYTLQDLTPTGVDEVALQRANGTQLCDLRKDQAETVAARGAVEHPSSSTSSTASTASYAWRATVSKRPRTSRRCRARSVRAGSNCGPRRSRATRTARPGSRSTEPRCTSGRWCRAGRSVSPC